ncbi:MucB/RseB C-terminal domain-containing protein [Alteromonas sp. a30]|uniref:MucB/RseB C-terminal domain-containing protein n=1 Tax=Alteromonas sp. a30 TaxID=2730917 RepID=UPI0022819FA1|nr:MucB/RseB C-terminal domain-containing protein [Alteromonas sp. a30]MCY7296608.1 sigma-E factor regulatory protein RseB [Alteromonas sp. a30]
MTVQHQGIQSTKGLSRILKTLTISNPRIRAGLLLVVGLLFASPSFANASDLNTSSSATDWLNQMRDSLRTLNYRISFVVSQDGAQAEPYLWRHGLVSGIEMEHLSLLNGPGREAFRVGGKVSYFEPATPPYSIRSHFINGPIPSQFFIDPEQLGHAYDIVLVGKSRVSGLAAQQIRIISKDNSRYSFVAWLDQQTALLLKLDMLDLEGKLLEQMQVTSLHLSDEADEYFHKIEQDKLPDITMVGANEIVRHQWSINWLPAGMRVVKRDVHRLPVTGHAVDYVLLSDGMVDVSVYVHPIQGAGAEKGWLRHESTTLLSLNNGNVEVAVVGKIPPETANAIATSIRPNTRQRSR